MFSPFYSMCHTFMKRVHLNMCMWFLQLCNTTLKTWFVQLQIYHLNIHTNFNLAQTLLHIFIVRIIRLLQIDLHTISGMVLFSIPVKGFYFLWCSVKCRLLGVQESFLSKKQRPSVSTQIEVKPLHLSIPLQHIIHTILQCWVSCCPTIELCAWNVWCFKLVAFYINQPLAV